MSSPVSFAGRRPPPCAAGAPSQASRRLAALIAQHTRTRAAGTMLSIEGEKSQSILVVRSGWLCVSKSTPDGNRLVIDVVLPGNIVDPGSADAGTSAVEIEALTETTCAAIPRGAWQRLVDESPDLAEVVHGEVGAALTRMSARMLRLARSDAESVIAYAFCELMLRSTGLRLDEITTFSIPMTQQQLGDFCGLSSVHVCRTLRRLRRAGVLDIRNHMDVTIHDIRALVDIAQIDPGSLRNEIMPRATLPRSLVGGGRVPDIDSPPPGRQDGPASGAPAEP